ncbi:MAG: molecular chaperone HscC [Gammaproteobacteria bacterium]
MIVGIDLGTTNSAAAVWRAGKPELIPNSLGHVLTPSAVSLDDDGQVLVGLAARERQVSHPGLTATAFKRYMGSRRTLTLGNRSFSPEELSALVLRSLKADAEAYLGEPVTDAVITVPAYFNDKQRKATRRAGELAGLNVERLINEPTAAALAYGIHNLEESARFLVFDLGGGTFDVTVLEIFEGIVEVRASTGDNFLGGEDFNELLIDRMIREFKAPWQLSHKEEEPALYQRIRAAAERARRVLTAKDSTVMQVSWQDKNWECAVTTDELEQLSEGLTARLREPVLNALRDSGISVGDLAEVVLVGGATRMPLVRKTVTRMFGRFPNITLSPDEAVALGAAVQAGLKARDAALKEVVLTDVCPYSLGVEIGQPLPDGQMRSGLFAPVIERNTVVPTSRVRTFSTLQNGQTRVDVKIYQGEARLVVDNILLGRLEIPVPARAAGEIVVDCRFTYDINGLLEVDVKIPQTGAQHQLVIVDEDVDTKSADVERRRHDLAALKTHPRDNAANRAALARAERCFQQLLGNKREYVSGLITVFETTMERQDPRQIDQARKAMLAMLDRLEGENFL